MVRIFLYSGLKGSLFNRRYIDPIGKQLIEPICLRDRARQPGSISPADNCEICMGPARIDLYIGVRKWVYDVDVGDEQATVSSLADFSRTSAYANSSAAVLQIRRRASGHASRRGDRGLGVWLLHRARRGWVGVGPADACAHRLPRRRRAKSCGLSDNQG